MAEVQYGGGLRLKELARLRVKDVDLERRQITIRQGKGDLDRVTVLPEALVEKMRGHLVAARRLHEADREAGHPGVAIPGALGKIDFLIPPCSPCLRERPSQRFVWFSQRRQEHKGIDGCSR
jgi:integrase